MLNIMVAKSDKTCQSFIRILITQFILNSFLDF